MTKLMRASFQNRLVVRGDGIAPPSKIGEVITANHPLFSEDSESTLHDRYAVVVLEVMFSLDPTSNEGKERRRHEEHVANNSCRSHNDQVFFFFTHPVLEFYGACEDFSWSHGNSIFANRRRTGCPKELSEEYLTSQTFGGAKQWHVVAT